jgi:hypothetical protein
VRQNGQFLPLAFPDYILCILPFGTEPWMRKITLMADAALDPANTLRMT